LWNLPFGLTSRVQRCVFPPTPAAVFFSHTLPVITSVRTKQRSTCTYFQLIVPAAQQRSRASLGVD
ncbi:Spike glycoprotein, partial [Dissostichus eleginoides]